MTKNILDTIGVLLERAQRPLFLNHDRADGDSLGSNLALFLHARDAGQSPAIYAPKEKNPKYSFLPGFDAIRTDEQELDMSQHDVIVCADVAGGELSGLNGELMTRRNKVIVIDHHRSTKPYGGVNYLDSDASSTAEMLYRVFRKRNWTMTPDIATCLVTGLLADTGVLRFPLTTPTTIRIAADLLEAGGAYHEVIRRAYESLPFPAMKLWARAMASVRIEEKTALAVAVLTRKDFDETSATRAMVEGLPNVLNQLDGVRGILLLEELPDGVKGSLRARTDDLNVAVIAALFGGGGHQRAAGFTTTLPIEEIRRRIGSMKFKMKNCSFLILNC